MKYEDRTVEKGTLLSYNELCNWSAQGMKPVEECKKLVDEGCDIICKAVLGNLGERAYRRTIIL
eukprot:4379526-Amphidinium_carterae.1